MMRKAFGLMLAVAFALSWVVPVCAMPRASSHACCADGQAPAPEQGRLPACCRVSEAAPSTDIATVQAPVPVLATSVVVGPERSSVHHLVVPGAVAVAPQAPPGTHSGLSPPSSGL